MKKIDLTGQRFGRLKVIKEAAGNHKRVTWQCICDCGAYIDVPSHRLRGNKTQSCGCLRSETTTKRKTTHGQAAGNRSRLYRIWNGIKGRCLNPNNDAYGNYGGRGIGICKEWQNDFDKFQKWAIAHGYNDCLSIDRIDINKNYEPTNCRWVSSNIQNNNTRRNHYITYMNETHTLAEWSCIIGIPYMKLYKRIILRGWDIERAFTV